MVCIIVVLSGRTPALGAQREGNGGQNRRIRSEYGDQGCFAPPRLMQRRGFRGSAPADSVFFISPSRNLRDVASKFYFLPLVFVRLEEGWYFDTGVRHAHRQTLSFRGRGAERAGLVGTGLRCPAARADYQVRHWRGGGTDVRSAGDLQRILSELAGSGGSSRRPRRSPRGHVMA